MNAFRDISINRNLMVIILVAIMMASVLISGGFAAYELIAYAQFIGLVTSASFATTYFVAAFLERITSRPISRRAKTVLDTSQRENCGICTTRSGNDKPGQPVDGYNEMLGQI